MRKRLMALEGEATFSFGEKRPRRSPLDEGAQEDCALILVESLDLASHDQSTLGVCLNETDAPLEDGVPAASPSNVEEVGTGGPLGVIATPAPPPKSTGVGLSKKQMLVWVVVSTYVPSLERVTPLMDTVAPDIEDMLKLTRLWSPFNQEDSPVVHMRDLYPNYFQIPMAARSEQYSVMLSVYMNKEDIHPVVDDGMLISNDNFHRLAELVCIDF